MGLRSKEGKEGRNEWRKEGMNVVRKGREECRGELREMGRRIGCDIGARCDDDAVVKRAGEDCKEATASRLLATRILGGWPSQAPLPITKITC